jgi:ABC-type lipoprotein release transport system permease subunit
VGRVLLVYRLAARDLRRRRADATLLLLAIVAATTTLTLGLVLHGVTTQPYQNTRTATAGPDVVADVAPPPAAFGGGPADVASLLALTRAPGVTASSGPYPVTDAVLGARGHTAAVEAEGRDPSTAAIDQPELTQGSWVRQGGMVVERAFADAFDVQVGDRVTLSSRTFTVVGVAVTAAATPYPLFCPSPCGGAPGPQSRPVSGRSPHPTPGLVWLTQADARSLTPSGALSYLMNLKLADPATAPAFVDAHNSESITAPTLQAWQDIRQEDGDLVQNEQRALLTGSWLLGLLALASIAVLVGGRMADQIRRVGLLKAVGATPRLVAAVLFAEYTVVALVGSAIGLSLGWLAAPLLTRPGAGLIGRAGAPTLTPFTIGWVTAAALAVTFFASFVPAIRAARTSTVFALADSAHLTRRSGWLIDMSARLPVPLLLGLRVAARRPRRVVLGAVSVAITVSGIVVVLTARAELTAQKLAGSSGLDNPRTDRLNQVLLVITIMLVALASVNTIFITWATVLDARHSSALARALGATPQQVSAGLSAAQMIPALVGAILGVPAGIALFAAVTPVTTTIPPTWWLVTVVLGTPIVVAALTTIPARLGARLPVAPILQSELA